MLKFLQTKLNVWRNFFMNLSELKQGLETQPKKVKLTDLYGVDISTLLNHMPFDYNVELTIIGEYLDLNKQGDKEVIRFQTDSELSNDIRKKLFGYHEKTNTFLVTILDKDRIPLSVID